MTALITIGAFIAGTYVGAIVMAMMTISKRGRGRMHDGEDCAECRYGEADTTTISWWDGSGEPLDGTE